MRDLDKVSDQKFEYRLRVWRSKDEVSDHYGNHHWDVHITNASHIPRIGEAFESTGFDAFRKYRVFDVIQEIGPVLSEPVLVNVGKLRNARISDEQKGLVWILAHGVRD